MPAYITRYNNSMVMLDLLQHSYALVSRADLDHIANGQPRQTRYGDHATVQGQAQDVSY